VISETGAAGM